MITDENIDLKKQFETLEKKNKLKSKSFQKNFSKSRNKFKSQQKSVDAKLTKFIPNRNK